MKSVLVVAYHFPPLAASGSMRPLAWCRYLERYGWLPRVLTTEPDSVYPPGLIDESLNARLPAHMVIDRVPDANPLPTLLHMRHTWRQKAPTLFPPGGNQLLAGEKQPERTETGMSRRYTALKDFMTERLFWFPDPQRFWWSAAVCQVAKLFPHERPDVVLATGGPWTALLVGKTLAQRFGVPFVADFRDPWTANPNKRLLAASLACKGKKLERSVCTAAARVIANTEELRAQFLVDYPELEEKFITLPNGFDRDGGQVATTTDAYQTPLLPRSDDTGVLEFCHFGTIYGNRDPLALLWAIKELLTEKRIQHGQLRVRFIGTWDVKDERCETLAQELEKEGFVQREPLLPHDACLQEMTLAKTLLILQPAYPLQIPGKIYEYIAAGRPLLVLGGEGATASLVERYRLGKCCPNQHAAIKELLWRLIVGQEHIGPPRAADITRFDYAILTGELARVLDAVCTKSQR